MDYTVSFAGCQASGSVLIICLDAAYGLGQGSVYRGGDSQLFTVADDGAVQVHDLSLAVAFEHILGHGGIIIGKTARYKKKFTAVICRTACNIKEK